MTITWKEILLAVIIIAAAFCLGIWVGYERDKAKFEKELNKLEEIQKQKIEEIDSLKSEGEKIDSIIIVEKERVKEVDTLRIITTEKLRTLPLDSSVKLLKQNLKRYEHFNPTCP